MRELMKSARTQLIVAVLLAALGFAVVAQVQLTRGGDNFGGQRRGDLVELIDSLSAASDRARQQIGELEQTRTDLESSSRRRQTAVEQAESRLSVLEILSGTVAAVGPGITVTIKDPTGAMPTSVLLNGIAELRDAGAEAIEVNDLVRVVASTSITQNDGVIFVDGVELRAPYVVDAIGSSHTLSEAVIFPGGLRDEVEQVDGTVLVEEGDVVEVGSLHTIKSPEYSQPTGS